MSNALEIFNLNKSFNSFSIENVSFSLPRGYIMGFIGPNGAGKTTVIKLILNLLIKDSGTISVFGLDHIVHEVDIKEKIGVVFDQTYYLPAWSIKDVEKAMSIFYKTWDSSAYYGYLKSFGIQPDLRIGKLSRGMKMKLMIAVALSHDTRLLILDEPTSGLDIISRNELMDILSTYILSEDRSIVFSTHTTSDLEKIADYITFINNGQLVYTGTKDDLLESWCLIKGSINDLSESQKRKVTGLLEHKTWFEGIIPVNEQKGLAPNIVTEPATIEDIIIFSNRGAGSNG